MYNISPSIDLEAIQLIYQQYGLWIDMLNNNIDK